MPGLRDHSPTAAINVTPMIDVMLVLLIIFMVVVPVLVSYEATPPEARSAAASRDPDVLTLGIDVGGRFWLADRPVADEELPLLLREAYAERAGERVLHLRADRAVSYARVLDAIEAARGAGVWTIGAITEPVEGVSAGGGSP